MNKDKSYTISAARALVIGEVKAEMARKGVTPTELGRLTGRGQQYWSRRTTGITPFDVDDFAVLSEILQVPMSRFMPEYTPGDGDGSPLSDLNRRPSLYIVGGSGLEDAVWPAEPDKLKLAA